MEDNQNPDKSGWLGSLSRAILRRTGVARREREVWEKLKTVIASSLKDPSQLDDTVLKMIAGVLQLNQKIVREAMVPRVDVVCIDRSAGLQQLKRMMVERGHSRIPVYDGSIDKIVGVAHLDDIVKQEVVGQGKVELDQVMRKPYFVPETKRLREILARFRADKTLLAIVVDEYGGTAGVVTVEDVLEEIVGEIRDEYEEPEGAAVQVVDDRTVIADGKADLDLLREYVDVAAENHDFDTVGGFVMEQIGSVPAAQESFDFRGLRFTVLEADERRVRKVKIERLGQESAAEQTKE